jgi:hypothetical protein
MAATILVEDGSIVSGANSYVTTTELATFADERGVTISAAETEDLLIKAMDYLENQNFKGLKVQRTQPLEWPRTDVRIDDVYWVNSDEIPQELKNAQMQIALSIDAGYSPHRVLTRRVKREKVDELEIEYADGAGTLDRDPKVNMWLRKLIRGGSGGLYVEKYSG